MKRELKFIDNNSCNDFLSIITKIPLEELRETAIPLEFFFNKQEWDVKPLDVFEIHNESLCMLGSGLKIKVLIRRKYQVFQYDSINFRAKCYECTIVPINPEISGI